MITLSDIRWHLTVVVYDRSTEFVKKQQEATRVDRAGIFLVNWRSGRAFSIDEGNDRRRQFRRELNDVETARFVICCYVLRQQLTSGCLELAVTSWWHAERMTDAAVNLIIKAPNQQIKDQIVKCDLGWTIGRLKEYLSEVYPSKPVSCVKVIISARWKQGVCFSLHFVFFFFLFAPLKVSEKIIVSLNWYLKCLNAS